MRRASSHACKLVAITLPLLGLTACQTATSAPPLHVSQPGYRCDARHLAIGDAHASASIHADGRPHSIRWEWQLRETGASLLRVHAIGSADGTIEADPDVMFASVQWAFTPPRRDLHRLELTTRPDSPMLLGTPLASDYERHLDIGLRLPWPDLLAFARGADRLTALIRRGDGEVIFRQDIDPAAIRAGDSEVTEVLSQIREMASDYQQRCEYIDDLEPNIILV